MRGQGRRVRYRPERCGPQGAPCRDHWRLSAQQAGAVSPARVCLQCASHRLRGCKGLESDGRQHMMTSVESCWPHVYLASLCAVALCLGRPAVAVGDATFDEPALDVVLWRVSPLTYGPSEKVCQLTGDRDWKSGSPTTTKTESRFR